jgi:hypothetical protein
LGEKTIDEFTDITNPTMGFDTQSVTIQGKLTYINEVGSAMISNWHKFIADASSIIVSI